MYFSPCLCILVYNMYVYTVYCSKSIIISMLRVKVWVLYKHLHACVLSINRYRQLYDIAIQSHLWLKVVKP